MEKIPFCLEAFKAGAVALNQYGAEVCLREILKSGRILCSDGIAIDPVLFKIGESRANCWTMKPTSEDDGWIPVKGDGTIPKEILVVEEFDARRRDGAILKSIGPASFFINCFKNDRDPRDFVAVRRVKPKEKEKPTFREADGWIPVKGDGTIPKEILGAKAYEWEIKYENNVVYVMNHSVDAVRGSLLFWFADYGEALGCKKIVAVRRVNPKEADKPITDDDGWIPVKGDGTIPEGIRGAKAREWEIRLESGIRFKPSCFSVKQTISNKWYWDNDFRKSQGSEKIVAVRLVKKEGAKCDCIPHELESCQTCGGDQHKQGGSWEDRMRQEKHHNIDVLAQRKTSTKEDEAMLAIQRFQSSDRGKEFRAQLGDKDAHAPAMGQDGIEGAIFNALCETFKGD